MQNCSLSEKFENKQIDGWLLGDSGYPLKPWLLTPFLNPSSNGEEKYNRCHKSTRNVIERAFGLLKSRFRYTNCSNAQPVVLLVQLIKRYDDLFLYISIQNHNQVQNDSPTSTSYSNITFFFFCFVYNTVIKFYSQYIYT